MFLAVSVKGLKLFFGTNFGLFKNMKRIIFILLISTLFVFTSCFNGKRLNEPVLLYIEYDYGVSVYGDFNSVYLTSYYPHQTYGDMLFHHLEDHLSDKNIIITTDPDEAQYRVYIDNYSVNECVSERTVRMFPEGYYETFLLSTCEVRVNISLYAYNSNLFTKRYVVNDKEKLVEVTEYVEEVDMYGNVFETAYVHYDFRELDYDVFEDLIRNCSSRFSNKASRQIYNFEEALNE